MVFIATTSPTTPSTASRRAGPASSTGVVIIARPAAARLAELTNTNGRSLRAAFQVGVAVSASSTAVYTPSAGAKAAASNPAGPSTARSTGRNGPNGIRSPVIRSTSAAAATPAPALKALRIHDPRLIGEVSLIVRSMLTNRSGRPRSMIERGGAEDHRDQRREACVAPQRRPVGQLRAGREQTRPRRDPAEEQVQADLVSPRRRLDDGTPVVRGEFGLGHHRHLARAVPAGTSVAATFARGAAASA